MLIFGVAFGRPPAPVWKDFGTFLASFWNHVASFVADAAKLQNCNRSKATCLVLGVMGLHFRMIFANISKFFFVLLSGLHFCPILYLH